MNEHEPDDASEPRIPARLAEELKSLYAPPRLVPPDVDAAVLGKAREYLAQVTAPRQAMRFPRWLAAAAAVLLAAWLTSLLFFPKRPMAREDVNRDGRVDVLDAFALALQLQRGEVPDRKFDFNRDGVVDQRDIDAVAAQAVKLEKGRG